jgi:hypothetical protein
MLTASPHDPVSPPPGLELGALIKATSKLWLSSLRECMPDALMSSLLPQLPLLLWWWKTRAFFAEHPLTAWLGPEIRIASTSDILIGVIANLAGLWFFLSLLHKQGSRLRGVALHGSSLTHALRCLPAATLATLIYTLLLLLALLPVGLAWLVGGSSDNPMVLLVSLLLGLLVSAAPLAWVSIAACFVYPPIVLDGCGAWSSLWTSFRLVRGRWVLSAGLLSLFTLICLGILGTLGSLPFAVTAAVVGADGELAALMRPGWLIFGQLLTTPLMAPLLSLLTAAYLVMYEALRRSSDQIFNSGRKATPG